MACSSSPNRLVCPVTSKEAPELGQAAVEIAESIGDGHGALACSAEYDTSRPPGARGTALNCMENNQNALAPPARISFSASAQKFVLFARSAPTCSTYSCQLFSISSLKRSGSVPSRI